MSKTIATLSLIVATAAADCTPNVVTCVAEAATCTQLLTIVGDGPVGNEVNMCRGGSICDPTAPANNATCIPAAVEGDACDVDADCYRSEFDTVGNDMQLECASSVCTRVTSIMPTTGCHQIGDECDADADCMFGKCERSWSITKTCQGLENGEACVVLENGCNVDDYCLPNASPDTTNGVCTTRIETGMASDADQYCKTGMRDADGNCAAPVLVNTGGDCSNSNQVCEAGSMCSFGETSTCVAIENFNAVTGDACEEDDDCGYYGFCEKSGDACTGTCNVDAACRASDVIAQNEAAVSTSTSDCKYGGAGLGRCPANGETRYFWEGSCNFEENCKAQRNNCAMDHRMQGQLDLYVGGQVCGQDYSGVCGSASATTASWAVALGVAAAAYALN